VVPALGIFTSPKDALPWDSYDLDRVFWTTSIVPMGGHIVVERLDCDGTPTVRVVVNGQTQAVSGCDTVINAPPDAYGLCSLDQFESVVRGRWEKSFCEACAPDQPECVDNISFFEP
jgi:hypothetical protein